VTRRRTEEKAAELGRQSIGKIPDHCLSRSEAAFSGRRLLLVEDNIVNMEIARLPVKLREAVLLYYYQNMGIEEVAEALGIAVSSASERLKRAKEKLRYALKEAYFNE
jgi:RNA polymerase sigma factor (sigma-70 family)